MSSAARTEARMLKAAGAFDWESTVEPDGEGNQRWRAADEAARHLASLSPERRAQLEREWKGDVL